MYNEVFASLFLLQVLLDFVLVHLLPQVAWLPATGMVREARRSSSCTTTLAGELFVGNQQHSTTSMCRTSHLRKFEVHNHATFELDSTEANKVCYDRGEQLEAARPVARSNVAAA